MSTAAEPQSALFLHLLDGPLPSGYERLYFGAEFCPWLLPQPVETVCACRAAHERGWNFTLATPVLAEPMLPKLRILLETLSGLLEPGDEVLISDWGALTSVREILAPWPILLGRALSGQKRGPRILDLSLGDEQREYFQRGSWHALESSSLLSELGIGRVELDNLLQGLAPLPAPLSGSLHTPYAMVTSSRNCPFRTDHSAGDCAARCGEVFRLETEQTRIPLFQGGNTQFLLNPALPSDLSALGIDRLVHHPGLPR